MKILLFLLLLSNICIAQQEGAKQYTIDMFMSQIGKQSGLNNGSEYVPITRTKYLIGHPFFLAAGWQKGSITYNNTSYNDVELLYDIVNDEIVIPYENRYLMLKKWEVSEFTINNHKFINILDSSQIHPGFYEVVDNIFIRHSKNIQEEENMNEKENVIYSKDKYYIIKDGIYQKASKDVISKHKLGIKDE